MRLCELNRRSAGTAHVARERGEGLVIRLPGDRARLEDHVDVRLPQTDEQLEILVAVLRVRLVEPADLGEDRGRERRIARVEVAQMEWPFRGREPRVVLLEVPGDPALERRGLRSDGDRDRAHHRDSRCLPVAIEMRCEPVGARFHVIVEEDDDLRRRPRGARVARRGAASLLFAQDDQAVRGLEPLDDFVGAVGDVIEHDDRLEAVRPNRLPTEARQEPRNRLAAARGRDDYRRVRAARRAHPAGSADCCARRARRRIASRSSGRAHSAR